MPSLMIPVVITSNLSNISNEAFIAMKAILQKEFGIQINEIKRRAGYDNANYLVIAGRDQFQWCQVPNPNRASFKPHNPDGYRKSKHAWLTETLPH